MTNASPYGYDLTNVGLGYGASVRVGDTRLDLGVMPRAEHWFFTIEAWTNMNSARSLRKPKNRIRVKTGHAANMSMVRKEFDSVIDDFVNANTGATVPKVTRVKEV